MLHTPGWYSAIADDRGYTDKYALLRPATWRCQLSRIPLGHGQCIALALGPLLLAVVAFAGAPVSGVPQTATRPPFATIP
ncbi:hypothetical protein [Haloarcula sp. Atlit-7R]|uniref:hypothetical protein n=1 Tax=Haloarcula sp. Atlit-7R TaxID=2282125 RepID=UPI0011C381F7|nr:hypothetical protein [Haloarcula sp. Atlit-7R]